MALTTAEDYLLVTEHIGQKPVLRTRFTTQAYFVFGAVLDLLQQGGLRIVDGRLALAESEILTTQPQFLKPLCDRLLTDLPKAETAEDSLKLVTSWTIANALYDGIMAKLQKQGDVTPQVFQNNLKPHVIAVPQPASRQRVLDELIATIRERQDNPGLVNLWLILAQQDALHWLISDRELPSLEAVFADRLATNSGLKATQQLAATVGAVIQAKKFWMDSWLS
ncbi:hypothetical protein IV54_GL000806 [Levilactobacillus paucivorans]|uniref:Uncharacterized protein n=1 Tax=Levilactobacillus paucivorans TaxID=616990 RepID=A0A0R2M049_9LACO|nr:hypothetical protein [Levilactobacillus paucivorans]KRO04781.1 hypothetical protein IV54_GL000806 [Levilactobacillus paucivorans]